MRVESWNPTAFDQEFENVAIERLLEAATVVANNARSRCPLGTISHPIYRRGPYAGLNWTSRDAGRLKSSIRVVEKKSKSGKPLSRQRNVRVYAGHYMAWYAAIVEFYTPFIRPALYQSIAQIKSITGAK
jgi:hypothetical protein